MDTDIETIKTKKEAQEWVKKRFDMGDQPDEIKAKFREKFADSRELYTAARRKVDRMIRDAPREDI